MNFLNKNKYYLLLALFVISLLSSLILSLGNTDDFCGIDTGCDKVLTSKYASTFGIKNSYYGIPIFAFLIILTSMQIFKPSKEKEKIINLGIIIGSLIALYLIFLQIFIIKSFCPYCLVVDISLLIALLIIILTWKK